MSGIGLGAFLSGATQGMQTGLSMQANKKLADTVQKKEADKPANTAMQGNSGTAIQNNAAQPGSFGLPGQMPPQSSFDDLEKVGSTGATASLGYNPTQSQVMPGTPAAKAQTNNNTGNWGTIAGYLG